jgi:hypothetical protein
LTSEVDRIMAAGHEVFGYHSVIDIHMSLTYTLPVIAIAETTYYSKRAAAIMSDDECDAVIEMIARDPRAGDLIPGSGGVRKLRIALEGRGKSGGARLIYYYYNDAWPVLLLEVFAKNEKANLSKAQVNALAKLVTELKTARKG